MKPSVVDLFNRIVYICCGVLLGVVVIPLWQSSDVQLDKSNDVSETIELDSNQQNYTSENQLSRHSNNIKFKKFVEAVIRDEIEKQLSVYLSERSAFPNELLNQRTQFSQNNKAEGSQELLQENTEQQVLSYQAAEQLLNQAVETSHWDSNIAKQLLSHLNNLTIEQELAIRTQYANAVNEGWIVPEMPLDMIEVQ
ncbi:hypothetical protein [Aliikangiella coralliicola]|uniref:Uncharacterized protein n=1 Tax=Aliikangiella coralliicola TaxID=2592383 RepID=A0A545UDR9_9GAMM|nr:hypothetical protein [Aliikangiella coralliicola]TQV87615.1 hypothetical protein FLL46_12150 [Aliikangiella coralliicola]